MTDTPPAELTGVSWTCTASAGSSCPAAGTGGIAASVDLLSGGSAVFLVTATVSPAASQPVVNTVFVVPPAGFVDPNPGNNSATDTDALACDDSIDPTNASHPASGGSGDVSVTSGSWCDWTAVANDGWIHVTSGSPGTGNGRVGYSVDVNSGAARQGTVTIAGKTFTLNQAAASCGYSINPTSASYSANGGAGNVTATAGSWCDWTATSNDAWVHVTSGSSGTGSGTVGYSVDVNTGAARVGTVTIADQTFTVDQAASAPDDEFQINTYTTSSQSQQAVAFDEAGNFVVVWASYGQDGDRWGIFGQRFEASGGRRGAEFQVNSYTSSQQYFPAVASDAAGGFVVVWTSLQDGGLTGVFGQRYDDSGAPRGVEFQVNSYTTDDQYLGLVASDARGNFVVVWSSYKQDGSLWGVFGQRYDASGVRQGAEFQINSQTTGSQSATSVAADGAGNFVVVWTGSNQDGSTNGVFGRRYDASGVPRGGEFQVNTYTTSSQLGAHVASDAAGDFVAVWTSYAQDGSSWGVFGQGFDAAGVRRGGEFRVNTYTTEYQGPPSVASDAAGDFIVAWASNGQDGSALGVFGQRFDVSGAARGAEFQVNAQTLGHQRMPATASDGVGNFVVSWTGYDASALGVFGRRFGGLQPAALTVDPSALGGNGILEPSETVDVRPSWRNANTAAQTFDGVGLRFEGPPASGVSYELLDAAGTYGTVDGGATAECGDCYRVAVDFTGTRPATHWDSTFTERLTTEMPGQTKPWLLHVGESFGDVPRTAGYYQHVETLLHKGVTAGCGGGSYCPANTTSRQQMTVFTLLSKEGSGYAPAACGTTPLFLDVPVTSPYCRWVEEMSRRGIVSGCGGGNFCPTSEVNRAQMAVFVLRTLDPAMDPPTCGTPVFGDVPASSPFCKWIEELARRGVVGGCGGGNYCPTNPVTRGQMGVFLTLTFGLTLYGP